MIRPLAADDWEQWRPLWQGYLDFYREPLSEEITARTFERLCANTDGMHGLIAIDEADGSARGLAHLVFHHSTWSLRIGCYLEDLFVARSARGTGLARELIEAVYEYARRAGADRVYWHTNDFNGPARSLYEQVARNKSFVTYEHDL
jgi:GNAT superfamily N-acetyltransferase